jgi:hypothetical protein
MRAARGRLVVASKEAHLQNPQAKDEHHPTGNPSNSHQAGKQRGTTTKGNPLQNLQH